MSDCFAVASSDLIERPTILLIPPGEIDAELCQNEKIVDDSRFFDVHSCGGIDKDSAQSRNTVLRPAAESSRATTILDTFPILRHPPQMIASVVHAVAGLSDSHATLYLVAAASGSP